jgi:hypothetical protein
MVFSAYSNMPQVEQHRQEMEALGSGGPIEMAYETDLLHGSLTSC